MGARRQGSWVEAFDARSALSAQSSFAGSDEKPAAPKDKRPHVVILGGGFGGLRAARELAKAAVRVTLIDRRNHHLFQPLLYQVATAALTTADIASPLRQIVHAQENTTVLLADARAIDADGRRVVLDKGEIAYDYLIVATGVETSWFGHPEWAEHALALKSADDALAIRSRILLAYEAAERTDDAEERARLLTFVVIGGGPTGVELSGALTEIARHTLARNFRRFDPATTRVVLIEGEPRLLSAFPEELSQRAAEILQRMGVTLRLKTRVTGIDEHGAHIGDESIRAATVLWAAGVHVTSLTATIGAPLDRQGRLIVEADLSVPGHPEIQVVGDAAHVTLEKSSEPGGKDETVPGMCPGAIQMGEHAAQNIARAVRGLSTQPFRYHDKGSLAAIGRSTAVASIGRVRTAGFWAWVLWVFVHIFYLIGFRNRIAVLFDWGWLFATRQRGARVIVGSPRERR